jgi:hypothetical protein
LLIRVFPAADQGIKSDFETLKLIQLNGRKFNPVQAVLGNEFHEHMSKVFLGRAGFEESRKVLRTTPTSEGDDGFHVLGH